MVSNNLQRFIHHTLFLSKLTVTDGWKDTSSRVALIRFIFFLQRFGILKEC